MLTVKSMLPMQGMRFLEAEFPMAGYHERIWKWFEALQPGVKPAALVECVLRGGGKSTTVELALARLAVRGDRRFALYVSSPQQAAERHVQAGWNVSRGSLDNSRGK